MSSKYRFIIDAHASRFTAHAFASGIASAILHNPTFAVREFSGEASFSGVRFGKAKVSLCCKTASLKLLDEVSGDENREIERVTQDEVLEGKEFPDIVFESSKVMTTKIGGSLYNAKIIGDLTLHGRTHTQVMDCQVVTGEDTLRAIGDFSVRQTDYGIQIASIAGNTLKLKDEVKIAFFLLGRRDKS